VIEQKIENPAVPQPYGGIDRRRTQRVMIRIGVTLYTTIQGEKRHLKVFTSDVNVHGALLLCPQAFALGAKFEMEHNVTREMQVCRVVRPPKPVGSEFLVPVQFEKSAPDFWKISFPPADWKPFES
jgi:hypothetical protein